MHISLLVVAVCVIAFFPQKTFSVSPDTLHHHTSAISPHEITLFGQRNIIQSDGIWILRDGKYFARSQEKFQLHRPNHLVVFKKEAHGIIGFMYYHEPPDAYCFSGDVDVNGDMLIQGIKVQQISLSSPWFSEEKRAIDLDNIVITMKISLSNLDVAITNDQNKSRDLQLETEPGKVLNALDFCDIFFTDMDAGTH